MQATQTCLFTTPPQAIMSEPTTTATRDLMKLLFLIDGTGSMENWVRAIKTAITQVSYINELTGRKNTTQFIIFRDYTLVQVVGNKFYLSPDSSTKRLEISPEFDDVQQSIQFLSSVELYGNTDYEEAVKTGLASALPLIKENTILILITDALPHPDVNLDTLALPPGKPTRKKALEYYLDVAANPGKSGLVANKILEAVVLKKKSIWSILVADPMFEMLRQLQQILVITNSASRDIINHYAALGLAIDSEMIKYYTQLGLHIVLNNTEPYTISTILIGIFMNLANIPFASDKSVLSMFSVYGNPHTLAYMNMKNGRLVGNCYMPSQSDDSDGMLFQHIPGMEINLATLISKFKSDPDFKKKVVSILDKVFTPDHVMCITTSTIWGKLWRECCKIKGDPLINALKDKLSGLTRDPRFPDLKKWVDESYNCIQEVLDFFKESMTRTGKKNYDLVLISSNPQMPRDDVLAIARGAINQRAIMEFLMSARVVEAWWNEDNMKTTPNLNGNERVFNPEIYVPYCINTNELFLYLPHLMCAGTQFSMFPACVLAILAFQSDNPIFKTRAERYLGNKIGRWIPIEEGKKNRELLSAFVNSRFVRLVRDFPQFLTAEERRFFKPLMNHVLLSYILNLEINVDLSWIPIKGNLSVDQKHYCAECCMSRSFTLMVEPNKCALCLYPDLNKIGACTSTLKSYMVKCSIPKCGCFYAVEHIKLLSVNPKCYFCREGIAPQHTTCGRCRNRFITPCEFLTTPGTSDDATPLQWLCAMCERCPSEAISGIPLTLDTILTEQPEMMRLMGLTPDTPLRLPGSLFKCMDSIHPIPDDAAALDPTAPGFSDIHLTNRPVHNIPELFGNILNQVENGEHTKDCCFCYESFHISQMYPICGNCPNWVCKPCGERYYGVITPGNIVNPAQMHCPMCKRKPIRKVINSYNPHFSRLNGTAQHVFDPRAFYAWCIDCNNICEAGQMACTGDGQMPDFHSIYKCDDCRVVASVALLGAAPSINAKDCPTCGVATEKAGGCNHITCPNLSCHAHWCWICNTVFPYDQLHTGTDMDIYEHMTHAHGGWWGNDDGLVQGAAEGYD